MQVTPSDLEEDDIKITQLVTAEDVASLLDVEEKRPKLGKIKSMLVCIS